MEDVTALICAWCRVVIRPGMLPATHGICPTCKARVRQEIRETLQEPPTPVTVRSA